MDPLDERLTRAGTAWREAQPPTPLPAIVPAAPSRWAGWRGLATAAGVGAVVLVAVGVLSALSPRDVVELGASPSPRPIALLTSSDPGPDCLLSFNSGTLARDARSGLGVTGASGARMVAGSATPVRWPAGYTAYEQAGRAVLVDAGGQAVAVDGDVVGFGDGGFSDGIQTACDVSLTSIRVITGDADIPNHTRPLTTHELVAIAADPRAVGTTVVAETVISLTPVAPAPSGEDHAPGTITSPAGQVPVFIDPGMPAGGPPGAMEGTFAFTIEAGGLRLLGPLTPGSEGQEWGPAAVAGAAGDATPIGALLEVDGWLRRYAMRCPATRPGPTPDPELPFGPCPTTGIADRPDEGERGTQDPAGITVQDAAWKRYGAIPGLDIVLPRYGRWLLQHVADPSASEPTAGWRVVARLPAVPSITVTVPLPTLASATGDGCRGIGLDATLTGDLADPRVAWLISRADGARIDVVWPSGYQARFGPDLEVLDADGVVTLREGDIITGGCTTGSDAQGPILITPGG